MYIIDITSFILFLSIQYYLNQSLDYGYDSVTSVDLGEILIGNKAIEGEDWDINSGTGKE